jgi:preprotein translocase subunit SecD
MSNSDYIPRLRSELLRAGATEPARWRGARVARGLRPLAAAAAVAVVVLAVVLALPDRSGDETPVDQTAGALHLTYGVPGADAATTEQAAQVMRERLAAAGIDDAGVAVSSAGNLTITAPARSREDVTALSKRGRLAMYDWERSVLGPRGVPAPADANVTGGQDVGRAAALTAAEAQARAASRPGAHRVRALSTVPEGWFALGGAPALTNADVESAAASADPTSREPIVAIKLTARGQTEFRTLTRELAHRGSARAAGGVDDMEALQHFAVVLDDRIVSTPYIDFRQAPDGIESADAMHISGGLTPQTARRTAALLSAGPLPADLVLESGG